VFEGWTRRSLAEIAEQTLDDLMRLEALADREISAGPAEHILGAVKLAEMTDAGKPLAAFVLRSMIEGAPAYRHRASMLALHRNVSACRQAVETGNWRWAS
jgi:hypothetical protein